MSAADRAFEHLLEASRQLARLDGVEIDEARARVAYGEMLAAIGRARRDGCKANLDAASDRNFDLAVLLGSDRIPSYIDSLIDLVASPVPEAFQRRIYERDIAAAVRRVRAS